MLNYLYKQCVVTQFTNDKNGNYADIFNRHTATILHVSWDVKAIQRLSHVED